ncbi:MAG: sensor histidine kinase [Phycisphaerales bacterium]
MGGAGDERGAGGAGGPGKLSALAAWQRGLLSRGAASIRRKLILLHTLFSLVVAAALLVALRQPVRELVTGEELRECRLALEFLRVHARAAPGVPETSVRGVDFSRGPEDAAGISAELAERARATPGVVVESAPVFERATAAVFLAESGEFLATTARSPEARSAVDRLYLLLTVALFVVYGVIALALEVLVLPRQVYGPIARLRLADEAVQEDKRELEVIPEPFIPADELGDIMRSRNRTVLQLRRQEAELEDALKQIERVATELRRKNELLEAAQRNLADQDRLASLGMMSAGIAHELNTPLSVLKGCVEELARGATDGGAGAIRHDAGPKTDQSRGTSAGVDPERAALMLRVVNRLERLSEGLLDFARVRPPTVAPVDLRPVVSEAWTLVSLDRDARGVELRVALDGVGGEKPDAGSGGVMGDADRLTQVFVNLLRNAVDALEESTRERVIEVRAERQRREGRCWVCVTVADSGVGIAASMLPRMFEPFASTRLDSTGTGLGLAVAEGIVAEHGGVLLARNASSAESARGLGGAVFEMLLPVGDAVPPIEATAAGGGGGTVSSDEPNERA